MTSRRIVDDAHSAPLAAINLEAFIHGPRAERETIAATVDDVCRATGFLIIGNHGVSRRVIDRAWSAAASFFDLPLETKLAVASRQTGNPRGYFPAQSETLARTLDVDTPPDTKESFSSGPLRPPPGVDAVQHADFFYGPNRWPPEPPGFRDVWIDYYRAMERLGADVLSLFAAALALEPEFFAAMHTHHLSALRALSYPAAGPIPRPGQRPAGAHSDYGSVTILRPDPEVPGLEIRLPSGEWSAAPLIDDAFLVNIGDMMARWTNDRWVSTVHRVVDAGTGRRRQSIAYFQNPNYDAEIRCIATCLDPDGTARYAPVSAGRYLMDKFSSTL